MKKLSTIILILTCLSSSLTLADGYYGGIGIGTSFPHIDEKDIQDYSEDSIFSTGRIFGGYVFTPNWSLEFGYKFYEEIDFYTEYDAVSSYDVNIEREDLYVAPVFEVDPRGFLPLRFAAGLSYSRIKVNVEEGFFNLAPSGKASTDDYDFGLYLMAGFRPFKFKHVSSLVAAEYVYRSEMFDDSISPLNTSEFMISFSVMLH